MYIMNEAEIRRKEREVITRTSTTDKTSVCHSVCESVWHRQYSRLLSIRRAGRVSTTAVGNYIYLPKGSYTLWIYVWHPRGLPLLCCVVLQALFWCVTILFVVFMSREW